MDSAHVPSQQQYQTPSFIFTNNDTSINSSPQPSSIYNMDENDLSKQEEVAAPNNVWTTPTSQPRPRPATIHEGFSYCLSDDFSSLQSWDSPSLSIEQTPSDIMSRPVSMHQEMFPPIPHDKNFWDHKPYGSYGMHGFDSEMPIGQAYTTDEAIPVLDLKFNSANEHDAVRFEGHVDVDPRRISGSSFTMSTSGALSDLTSCDDFSTALSEAPSYSSDYRPTSNRNSLMSSTHLSPVASPRMTPHGRTELVRTQSRGRASPSPRPHARSAPYSVEVARNKRWSTGSYGNVSNRRVPQPYMYNGGHDAFLTHQPHAPFLVAGPSIMQRNSMLLPSQLPSQQLPSQPLHHDHHHLEAPAPLLSHGLFRMLQSNGDPHSLHGHFTDLSDPPDLFASLHEEQIPPPPEDMNPSDPDMVPHEQELRFEGDLYTPRWVRGHGNKREGWCGICKPGRWLVLKNSAYWYDKSFTHGISAATGNPFQEPQDTRRMDGNPDVWEGLCGSCNEWIALVSSKKKGTTWFRHAYKCHTHTKVKDAPKRRRESSNSRSLAASNMARPKPDPSTPTPTPTPASAATMMPQLPPQHHMTSAPPPQHHMTSAPPPQHHMTSAPPPQHHHVVHVSQPQIVGLEASYPNMI